MLKFQDKLIFGWVLVTIGLMAFAPETSQSQGGRVKNSTKPTVSSISPTSATAGGASFTLTVVGTNFVSGALVQWVGSTTGSISTTLVSSSQLQAMIPSTLLTAAGTVQVSVYDPGKGGGTSNSATFTINTVPSTTTPLAIATTSLSAGTSDTSYSQTLAATGGTFPYTWRTTSGSLPTGLSLAASGAISGTPTTSGTYSFTAQVTDSDLHTASYTYSVLIAAYITPSLSITTASVPNGSVSMAYGTTVLAATGGNSPYTWSVASGSALPGGLTLSTSGTLSGTPTTAATYSFTVQVKDSTSNTSAKAYSMTVVSAATTATGVCVNSTYGVCGDPYEGLGPPPNQQAISACGKTIGASGNYKVSQNIGTDPTATCITINYNTTHVNLDLGGFTITGAICDGSGNGNTIYNGTVTCNRDQSAYPQASVDIYNQITSGQARIHHLAVQNQHELNGVWAVMFEMDNPGAYSGGGSGLGMPCRADHISMTSITGTGVGNRYGGIVSQGNCSAEFDHNYIHCTGGLLNACQGMGVGQIPFAYLHDNQVQMDTVSGTTQDGRALMCDQGAGVNGTCDIYNNLVYASNNRAIRYREFPAGCSGGAGPWGIQHGSVYNNTISNSQETGRLGVIHVGEDDCNLMTTAINVYNNNIELNGGNGIVVVSANGVTASSNAFTCFGGNCTGGGWPMFTDALGYSGGQTSANFKNNTIPSGITNAVKVCGPPGIAAYGCTTSETSAATVCSTGKAVGNGTISTRSSPCP